MNANVTPADAEVNHSPIMDAIIVIHAHVVLPATALWERSQRSQHQMDAAVENHAHVLAATVEVMLKQRKLKSKSRNAVIKYFS